VFLLLPHVSPCFGVWVLRTLHTVQTTFTGGPDSRHPCSKSFDPYLRKHFHRVLTFLVNVEGCPTLVLVVVLYFLDVIFLFMYL
jgi:hypothetical protein